MNLFRHIPLSSWHYVRGLALRLKEVTEVADRERLERELNEALGHLRVRFLEAPAPQSAPSSMVPMP